MIEETCVVIGQLGELSRADRDRKHARRNRIRYIDDLINQFELLNLAEEIDPPTELRGRVKRLVDAESHPLSMRPVTEVGITDWMDALYDLQDTLMLSVEDDVD